MRRLTMMYMTKLMTFGRIVRLSPIKGALYRWSYGSIIPIFRFSGMVITGATLHACHRKTWAVTSSLAET